MAEQKLECPACHGSGQLMARIQYTDRRKPCTEELRPCPFCSDKDTAPGELPLRAIHVNVRLKGIWATEWRQMLARDLSEATKLAEAMPDVQQVYEVSFLPGGVVT